MKESPRSLEQMKTTLLPSSSLTHFFMTPATTKFPLQTISSKTTSNLFKTHSNLHPHFPLLSISSSSSSSSMTTNAQSNTNPPPPPPSNPSTKTVRCLIKGRVQGVFYRNWTVENARELGLNGWVRNRRDGSVEALFSGDTNSVNEMEQRCRRGPPDAVVTGFQVFPSNDDPGQGFDKKPTV